MHPGCKTWGSFLSICLYKIVTLAALFRNRVQWRWFPVGKLAIGITWPMRICPLLCRYNQNLPGNVRASLPSKGKGANSQGFMT